MLRVILFSFFTISVLAQPVSPPAPVLPPISPPIAPVAAPVDEKKVMLNKLIQAGILMLEAKAYQQFIQAFVSEDDRRRFEQAFSKNGPVNYEAWGKDKGELMLKVLKKVAGKEPVWTGNRACFLFDDPPGAKFSFTYTKAAWFIENHSKCADPADKK